MYGIAVCISYGAWSIRQLYAVESNIVSTNMYIDLEWDAVNIKSSMAIPHSVHACMLTVLYIV